jgi:DNA segregation ATPase FtsK/SpoIIIE, S-DNA-T family
VTAQELPPGSGGQRDAAVIPFPAQPGEPAPVYDTSFEHDLDPEPPPGPPVPVDAVDLKPIRRDIIPPNLRTIEGIKSTVRRNTAVAARRTSFHAVRLPFWYLPASLFWSVWALFKLAGSQIRWWWGVDGGFSLMQECASNNDPMTWSKLRRPVDRKRSSRGMFLLAELVAVAVTVLVVLHQPLLVQLLVLAVLVPVLAHYGRPADRPIISAAVVTPRHRRLTADIVLRAYYRAKLGNPDKDDEKVTFGSKMSRDRYDTGSQVVVNMPYGTPFSKVMGAKESLASGLDVSEAQVYLTREKHSNRSHTLYVADVDPLSIPAGRTPLLNCRPTDIWRPMPMGKDVRNQTVRVPILFENFLVAAQPRQGKTFSARHLALYVALDPYVRLSVFDAKASPDWRKFVLVAYTHGFGIVPRNGIDPIETLRATLRAAWREVQDRNDKLSQIEARNAALMPEGKLTREISRDRRYAMPVWVIILEEFQDYLNTGDPQADDEISDLLVRLVKAGPSSGIVLVSSTQKPVGLGSAGKIQKRFTDFRDQHSTRFGLRTGSYDVSNQVLGSSAYGEGFDCSALPNGPEYKGVGILYGSPAPAGVVRTFLANGQDAEKILTAARALRERAGTLDGMAAGDEVAQQVRDPLADTLDAFAAGETFVSWETLAVRLAEQMPDRYAKVTKDALSNTLTQMGLGIESKSGSEKGRDGRPRGVYRTALDRAMSMRHGREQ